MQTDDLTEIRVTIEGHVALVTMDNPPVNAQSRALAEQLTAVMDRATDTDEIRCLVLTGAGRVFCAGADLKGREALRAPGALPAHSRRSRECYHSIRECAKPVIAAINGPALGAGLAIAVSCDILIASEKANLGLPEIDVGLLGGARHTMRVFGHSLRRRMLLTGYRVPAAELYRLGIIEACVPPEDLLPTAMEMAHLIASKAPLATRMAKHAANSIEEMGLRDGYRYEQDMTAQIAKTEDAREAQLAFAEKRKPVFKGR
jgi:enoyl-CoA hydratase/carnithine racemase